MPPVTGFCDWGHEVVTKARIRKGMQDWAKDQGGNTYITDVWDSKGARCTESTFYRKFQGHLTPEERHEVMTIDKFQWMADLSCL